LLGEIVQEHATTHLDDVDTDWLVILSVVDAA
jgi:hypothetical protein